ncbi:MAG: 2-hydroxyglutaryl-CoA dehydratase [Ignavibacteriales bacterium]|nr:2-hydroxyglutaryl-CoA dehydratase [Ignavibacteriales bacterium]
MLVAGVDVGSTQTKAIIVNENAEIVARGIVNTGANVVKAAEKAFQTARSTAKLEEWDVSYTVGTGYGRYKVLFGDAQITEISCHARGASFLFPNTKTILDIGGQDTKGIRINEKGEVIDFCMNDKCAAGTGRFLAAAADVMGITLDELGDVALQSNNPLRITNVCTVFVETEIMNHLSKGKKGEDILAGVHQSIAARSVSLLRRVGLEPEITFTGGVSKNRGMIKSLEEKLGLHINVNDDSQFIGAIGAALFALDRAKARHDGEYVQQEKIISAKVAAL